MKLPRFNDSFMQYAGERKNKISFSGISIKVDWHILLVVTLLVFIILTAIAFRLYLSVEEKIAASNSKMQQNSLQLNERTMRTALDDLLERRTIPGVKAGAPVISTTTPTIDGE